MWWVVTSTDVASVVILLKAVLAVHVAPDGITLDFRCRALAYLTAILLGDEAVFAVHVTHSRRAVLRLSAVTHVAASAISLQTIATMHVALTGIRTFRFGAATERAAIRTCLEAVFAVHVTHDVRARIASA